MVALTGASLAFADPRLAAAGGALALAGFVIRSRGAFAPDGGFGAANAVTAMRLGLVLSLSASNAAGPREAVAVALFLCLDGVDGWLARRTGTATAAGARFDLETDALFVLVSGLKLAIHGRLGPFIVLPGLLRYFYAGALVLLPGGRGDAPPSLAGRLAFALLAVALAASFWPVPGHGFGAGAATCAVIVSFARSALFTWGSGTGVASLRTGEGKRGEGP